MRVLLTLFGSMPFHYKMTGNLAMLVKLPLKLLHSLVDSMSVIPTNIATS